MTNQEPATVDLGGFRRGIATSRQKAEVAEQQSATDFATRQRSQVRATVARLLAWFFVAYVAVIAILVVIGALTGSPWKEPGEFLVEVLKSGILPVITFVLGHYFGSESK